MFRVVFSLNEHENIEILIFDFLDKVELECSQEVRRFLVPSVSSLVKNNRKTERLCSFAASPSWEEAPKNVK